MDHLLLKENAMGEGGCGEEWLGDVDNFVIKSLYKYR